MIRQLLFILCFLKIGYISFLHADSIPTLSRVYADYFISGVLQNPDFSQTDHDLYLAEMNQVPNHSQQGSIDFSFALSYGNNLGLQIPVSGFCGSFLQQKVKSIQELPSGNFLIGMDGKLDTSNSSNMIVARLTAEGAIDNHFGSDGFMNLPQHQKNEYLVSALQDQYSDFYVAGYGPSGSIVRKYDAAGRELWVTDNHIAGSCVVDAALQGTTRLLVAHQLSLNHGELVAYDIVTGAIDTTFYKSGVVPGVIKSPDFGLQIERLYGVVVNSQENIFITYKNSMTGGIDLTTMYKDGRSLISHFASNSTNPGVAYDLFPFVQNLTDNVCLTLDNYQNILVAASTGQDIVLVRLDGQTGNYDFHFNDNGRLLLPSIGDDIIMQQMISLSDGSIILVGSDQASATMLIIKITIAGQLDQAFCPQSKIPGIAYFKVGNPSLVYSMQSFMGLCVQSLTGNLVVGGYLQQMNQSCSPIAMRFYGQPGLMQIQDSLHVDMIPGMPDGTINQLSQGMQDLSTITDWMILENYTAYAVQANIDGTMYIAFCDGNNVVIGLIDANMYPVLTFGINGLTMPESMLKVSALVVDSLSRPIVVGKDHGTDLVGGPSHREQKIIRYTTSGNVDTEFMQILPLMTGSSIAEQKSGQIVVAGYMKGTGVVCGYQNDGQAFVNSFGPFDVGGYYRIGINTPIEDLIVDDQDAIYLIYRDENHHLCLEKIMPNGACKVAAFNGGNAIDTGIVATSRTHIALNSDLNLVVGSSTDQGIQFSVYNGQTGTSLSDIQTIPLTDDSFVLTKMVGSGTCFIGSCFSQSNNTVLMFRISGSTGMLDVDFGSSQNGIASFDLESSMKIQAVSVQLDGRILGVGGDGRSPLLMRLHGDSYIGQYPQMPGKAPAGTLDATLFYTPIVKSTRDDAGTLDMAYGAFNFNSLSSIF